MALDNSGLFASRKTHVYTDLSTPESLFLEIDGKHYPVTQYSTSWAANEVPYATVLLAVGRNVADQLPAEIHNANDYRQMVKAKVWFLGKKEYGLNTDWPENAVAIFDGFLVGLGLRKVSGKMHVVANLVHWLAALSFSSSVSANSHVSNPTSLSAAAVLDAIVSTSPGNYISSLSGASISANHVVDDIWEAIKSVFCALAQVEVRPPALLECGGAGTLSKNDGAIQALERIEGPGESCAEPYRYGVPLKMNGIANGTIASGIASAIGTETVQSWAYASFWDKLVGQFCPMFGLAVVPMMDTAIVVADVPAFRGGVWKDISADEYSAFDSSCELSRPLRAVATQSEFGSQTQGGFEERTSGITIGGCYAEDSVTPADGMVLFVSPPMWISCAQSVSSFAGNAGGTLTEKASRSTTTPVNPPDPNAPTWGTFGTDINKLLRDYCHDVYVHNMLRGRSGSFSGKLRFDIAPLSIVKINTTSERFIGAGQDQLAVTMYGCVQRVNTTINAEAGLAGTTFLLSHVRTEAENQVDRTSVDRHPLFGQSIHGGGKHGSPLHPDFDLAGP